MDVYNFYWQALDCITFDFCGHFVILLSGMVKQALNIRTNKSEKKNQ